MLTGRIVRRMSNGSAADLGIAGLRLQQARLEGLRRWRSRLAPAVFIGLTALAGFQNRLGPLPGLAGRGLAISAALVVVSVACLGAGAAARRSLWGHRAASAVMIAAAAVLVWAQPTGPGFAGVFVGAALLAWHLPWRVAVALMAAVFTVLLVVVQRTGVGLATAMAVMVAFGGVFGVMFLADRLSEAGQHAARLLAEAEGSRAAQAQAAGLAERQRLAREMHDVLAHSLSGLMLQLEAARMLAAGDPGDPRLSAAIDRAHHLAKSGLDEARRAIGMLRGDELPGPQGLVALAAQFQQDRGIPCELTVSGSGRRLSSQASLALYRVAQEALTNVTKHASPDRIEMHLHYQPTAIRLTVEDFTAARRTRQVPASYEGYGLTGMRERAELLGGTLATRATPTGFLVELEVPG
jgi:signal transduction histidine kinase